MIRAVIDTNVFVSGIMSPKGPTAKIIELIYENRIIPVITPEIYDEIGRVLKYPKLKLQPHSVEKVLVFLKFKSVKHKKIHEDLSGIPEDDKKFAAVAIGSGTGIIITGNLRHFKTISNLMKVITPSEFLQRYFPE